MFFFCFLCFVDGTNDGLAYLIRNTGNPGVVKIAHIVRNLPTVIFSTKLMSWAWQAFRYLLNSKIFANFKNNLKIQNFLVNYLILVQTTRVNTDRHTDLRRCSPQPHLVRPYIRKKDARLANTRYYVCSKFGSHLKNLQSCNIHVVTCGVTISFIDHDVSCSLLIFTYRLLYLYKEIYYDN